MERRSFENAHCSIARSMDVLGDWWNPLIIRECLYGVTRFDELQGWLNIGRNILAQRLAKLVDQGILERRLYQERPPRYEYQLTEKGYDAAKVVIATMPFGDEWMFGEGREPIRIYDRETHQRVRPVVVDANTGEPIDPRQLYAGPGPAFPPVDDVRRRRFVEYYERRSDPG
ncbi:MAG: helix-turn-helix transcriptional regulator [Myxococcales bacterium]|nr:helix-turn-helix transcriptional regulator [Myxococcales bacterium]